MELQSISTFDLASIDFYKKIGEGNYRLFLTLSNIFCFYLYKLICPTQINKQINIILPIGAFGKVYLARNTNYCPPTAMSTPIKKNKVAPVPL